MLFQVILVAFLHLGQSQHLGQPQEEQLEGDEFDDTTESVDDLLAFL